MMNIREGVNSFPENRSLPRLPKLLYSAYFVLQVIRFWQLLFTTGYLLFHWTGISKSHLAQDFPLAKIFTFGLVTVFIGYFLNDMRL